MKQQTPEMKANLEAFAAGINAYAAEHPEKLSAEAKVVLPVSGVDVIEHWERVMEYLYLASPVKTLGASPELAAMDPAANAGGRAARRCGIECVGGCAGEDNGGACDAALQSSSGPGRPRL